MTRNEGKGEFKEKEKNEEDNNKGIDLLFNMFNGFPQRKIANKYINPHLCNKNANYYSNRISNTRDECL